MKYFNPIERDFIAPIDLQVANDTLTKLEAGHQQAVKTASELEIAIANLDMNEAEDGFKYGLLNDIKNTVTENTFYGNSYAALDNLVKKQGNLLSSPEVRGRLQAQKDYKEYLNTLNGRNDLTEWHKEYFRNINGYNYTDKFDSNGNIIGGSKWQPRKREVGMFDLAKAGMAGINIAAKEYGTFTGNLYDENYEAVTDSSKARFIKDGHGNYVGLTGYKVKEGIRAYIEGTPGAKASLDQDWEIANWYYDRDKKNNPDKLIISDITDEQGRLLDRDEYLDKRIQPFVNAAVYMSYQAPTGGSRGDGGLGSAISSLGDTFMRILNHIHPEQGTTVHESDGSIIINKDSAEEANKDLENLSNLSNFGPIYDIDRFVNKKSIGTGVLLPKYQNE